MRASGEKECNTIDENIRQKSHHVSALKTTTCDNVKKSISFLHPKNWTSNQEGTKKCCHFPKNLNLSQINSRIEKLSLQWKKMRKLSTIFLETFNVVSNYWKFFRRQHTFIFQLECIQCIDATRHLTKTSRNACGSCAKNAIMLGWCNRRRKKQARKTIYSKKEQRNHVKYHLGDLEGMVLLIAAQNMKLIFVVWNCTKTSIGSQRNTSRN